jgi:hypothetical protein
MFNFEDQHKGIPKENVGEYCKEQLSFKVENQVWF